MATGGSPRTKDRDFQQSYSLPSLLAEAQQQLQVVQTSIRHIERKEQHLSRLAHNLTRQINTRYDLLVAAITQSRDELLVEFSDREEQARSQLLSDVTCSFVTVDTLSGLVSRASRASGNDVISIRKELQAALLSEHLLNHHRQLTVRQDSWPVWTYDVPEVSAVPATACMGRVVEAGADDVNKPLTMANTLGRLENNMTETKAEVTETKVEVTQTTAEVTKTKADVAQNKAKVGADDVTKPLSIAELAGKLRRLENDMRETKAEVKQTKADVAQNKVDLTETKAEITQTRAEVTKTMTDVAQNKVELTETKAEITQTRAEVTKTMTDVAQNKVELTETKAEITQTRAEVNQTKADVEQNRADLTETTARVAQNTAQINTISTSVKEQADKMDKAGTMVTFHAWEIDKTKTKQYQPIVFSRVTVNDGGGYQKDTGVFTVPVAGTYIFSAGVKKKDGNPGRVVAVIKVDSASHYRLEGSSTSTGTQSLSLRLDKGQKVRVKACSDIADYDSYTNYFTGALVQPQQ